MRLGSDVRSKRCHSRHALCKHARVRRWVWVIVPFASLCVLLGVGIESVVRTSRALARLSRADDVRVALDNLVTSFDDAESGERAYLATGDARFLVAYDRVKTTWRDDLASFRRTTDATQRNDVDAIEWLAKRMLDALDRTLAARDAGADVNALSLSLQDAGMVASDIRRVGARVESDARRLASRRVEAATQRERWEIAAFVVVVLSFAVGVAIVTRQRRRAEERAALAAVTDEFIAVLGHDLRNPLGATLMAAKLLGARALKPDEAMFVQRIRNSTERMLRMIDALLDVARTRRGTGIPVARTPCDLRDVIANVIDEIRTQYPDRRVSWEWRGDGFGRWDHDRMSQAVSNLLGNAIEHGDPASVVEVELKGVESEIELAVHNCGEPIPAEALPTLFAPYKRRASATHHGLGLGLFIADQIIRAHGGELCVVSTTVGTTFTASFKRPPETPESLQSTTNKTTTSP